jgi:hypothetical protein
MSDRLYTLQSLLYLGAAVAIPVATYRVMTYADRRRHRDQPGRRVTVAARFVAFGTALILSPILLVFAMCNGPPPGESDKARATMAKAAVAISALDSIYTRGHSHLGTLEQIGQSALTSATDSTYPITFARDALGYRLTFWYSGPGSNTCVFASRAHRWQCSGAF